MMTPEKKFEKDLLYVLTEIKKKSLYALKDKPIEYWVNYLVVIAGGKLPSAEEEAQILEKLQEMGAIKIIKKENSPSDVYIESEVFYLELVQPKFSELYEKAREPFKKTDKYKEFSSESIKQIVGILKKLKDEYNLATPKKIMDSRGYRVFRTIEKQTSIPQSRYWGWLRECEIEDYYRLESILKIMQEEGLILEFKSVSENR